jgi:eukaryotic-like serine/threonine-protein kinase
MIPPREQLADRESRLDAALGAYFAEAAAGRVIDRRRFAADHPDLADDLVRFFDDDDALEELLSPLRPARAPAPAVGTSLGDYELLEVIGTGGTGVVYKAWQRSPSRLVALKALRGGALASADGMRRFRAEIETVAALEHPNIVPLYDVGEHAGQPFFTMKLLEGGDLARRVATGTQSPGGGAPDRPPAEAARVMVEVARAVHYAHQRGVLHRDLKPSNVLLDAGGRPHVADFGLAKWLTADASLTETGALVGTPGYMAPEQTASGAEVTTATDVYGLGTVLYFLLTGRPPFRGATPLEIVTQVREREPEPPSRWCRAVGRDLETVCLKCLWKEPGQRYRSALELAEDLERWLRGEPVTARRAGRVERLWRWCRRNPAVAALSAAFAMLLAVVAVGLVTGLIALSRETEDKERARAQAVENARSLRRRLYASDMRSAHLAWRMFDVERMRTLLKGYEPAPGEEDLRGFEWHYLDRLSRCVSGPRATLADHLHHALAVAYSPDGKTLATVDQTGVVRVREPSTGDVRFVLLSNVFGGGANLFNGGVHSLAFSPDGETLAGGRHGGRITLWDLRKKDEKAPLIGHEKRVNCIAYSPDGRFLASGSEDGTIRLWDMASGKQLLKQAALGPVISLAFSPDGGHLATATLDGRRAQLWNVRFGAGPSAAIEELKWPLTGRDFRATCVRFSHDGRFIAVVDGDGALFLISPDSRMQQWPGAETHIRSLAFSPDDRFLLVGSDDGLVRQWDMPSGTLLHVYQGHKERVYDIAVAPDGSGFASSGDDNNVNLWTTARRTACTSVVLGGAPMDRIACSPDGTFLAVQTAEKLGTYEIGTWQRLAEAQVRAVRGLAISSLPPAIATSARPEGIIVWDGHLKPTRCPMPEGKDKEVGPIAFDPSGRFLIAEGPSRTLWRWDVGQKTWAESPAEKAPEEWGILARSPAGNRVSAIGLQATLKLADVVPITPIGQSRDFGGGVWAVAFSPSGDLLAVATTDRLVRLWDASTGQARGVLSRQREAIHGLAFSPDGKILAGVGRDGVVKLWQLESREETLTLLDTKDRDTRSVAFSPDGRYLIVGGKAHDGRGALFVWDAAPGEPGD